MNTAAATAEDRWESIGADLARKSRAAQGRTPTIKNEQFLRTVVDALLTPKKRMNRATPVPATAERLDLHAFETTATFAEQRPQGRVSGSSSVHASTLRPRLVDGEVTCSSADRVTGSELPPT